MKNICQQIWFIHYFVQKNLLNKMLLFLIATIKLALKKKNFYFFINTCIGYLKASINKVPFMVTVEEGAFIRSYRWRGIKKAILLKGIKNL